MAVTSFGAVRGGLMASLRQGSDFKAQGAAEAPDNAKNVMSRFRPPFTFSDGVAGTAVTTSGAVNVLTDGEGNAFSCFVLGEFSGTAPQVAAHDRGALIQLDASATNDGLTVDLGYGLTGSEIDNCRGSFVVGTDDAFYIRVRLDIGDVSDSGQVAVGFVKDGTPTTGLLDDHSDYAALNVNNGDILIETRLNAGSASVTDTTDDVVDFATTGDVHDLEVRVSDSGKVNFLIDGAEPTVDVTNFAFDSGDRVNAVVIVADLLAAGDPTVVLHEWESGFLSARGPDSIVDLED